MTQQATTIDWTREQSADAIAQGWEIFQCDDGRFQLEAIDDHSLVTKGKPFKDDKAAWKHVWQRAQQGKRLERHALEFLRQRANDEYVAIRCYNS